MNNLSPELKNELLAFIKENLSIQVVENSSTVDRSYGDYCEKTTFTIQLVFNNEVISEDNIYYYNNN